MEDVKRRGRPRKEDTKNNVFTVRLSEEDAALLMKNSFESGDSCSDYIRKAVRFYAFMTRKSD